MFKILLNISIRHTYLRGQMPPYLNQ